MFRKTTLFMALAGLASTVSAQMPGDILFATNDRAGGSDTIQLLDYGSLTSSTLVSFAPAPLSQHRLIGGIARDAGGAFYFTNSPSPEQNPSTAAVYQVTDMFNPGLRTVNNFFSSDPVQSIEGMAYDAVTNNVLLANNPASAPVLPLRMEGILGIDVANPVAATVIIAEDPFTDPRPRPNSFNTIVGDRLRAGNFYVGSVNGGVEDDPTLPAGQDREASMISRLVMNNPSDPTDVTFSTVIDLSTAFTGLSDTLSVIRGIASADNGNLYIVEQTTRSLYEVALDGNGDFSGISKILDLDTELDSDNTGVYYQPFAVIFNEYTGKLNYVERNFSSGNLEGRIVEVNLDGTGRNVLLDNVDATALYAVPAPATLALVGFGGLAATRRRR